MKELGTALSTYDPKGETGLKPENLTAFPKLAQMLARMVERMAEPGQLDGRSGDADRGGTVQLTPAQAKAALAALQADPVKAAALMSKEHPMHATVVEERKKLNLAAYPPREGQRAA
jgi:hypothetical protein